MKNQGTIDQPKVSLSIWSQDELGQDFLNSITDEIKYRYNFQLDLTKFIQRFRNDSQLGSVINKWQGMKPLNVSSLYEYLIIAIVLQNATVRRSVNMMKALFENYGTLLSYDGKELFCFWELEVIDEAILLQKVYIRVKTFYLVTIQRSNESFGFFTESLNFLIRR
ncbi:unnamed protein product [marine sediment metagenome]|uniref:HhH-GPD domain-containing protein n=1 Tax=marine sediment metagenome TaxID=412755 RepID=X1JA63_9ZZZZ